jgi:hypothetical protein
MTNELERTFFDTFGIEPITQAVWNSTETKWKNFESWEEYPQITDTHYLKLICELSKCKAFFNNFYRFQNVDIEQLKEQVLTDCIYQAIYFKHQVRKLFEEE